MLTNKKPSDLYGHLLPTGDKMGTCSDDLFLLYDQHLIKPHCKYRGQSMEQCQMIKIRHYQITHHSSLG